MAAAKKDPEAFRVQYYNITGRYRDFAGPLRAAFRGESLRVGEQAPLFELPDLDGGNFDLERALSTHHVAIVFGSYSAWPCVVEIPELEQLNRELAVAAPSCEIVFMYTREIHPGEALPPTNRAFPAHTTIDMKFDAAKALRDDFGLSFKIVVDDLAGSVHAKYGELPFSQVVVHRDGGSIVHRSEWGDSDLLGSVLRNLERAERRSRERTLIAESGGVVQKTPPAYNETLWYR